MFDSEDNGISQLLNVFFQVTITLSFPVNHLRFYDILSSIPVLTVLSYVLLSSLQIYALSLLCKKGLLPELSGLFSMRFEIMVAFCNIPPQDSVQHWKSPISTSIVRVFVRAPMNNRDRRTEDLSRSSLTVNVAFSWAR